MEGASRIVLCSIRPEIAGNLLDPQGLRDTNLELFRLAMEKAKELHYNESPELQEIRYNRWMAAFRLASLQGIREGIEKHGGLWKAIPHIHTNDQAQFVAQGADAYERGDFTYAQMNAEWLLRDARENWASWAVYGEVMLAQKRVDEAEAAFRKSVEISGGEKWPKGGLERCRSFSSQSPSG